MFDIESDQLRAAKGAGKPEQQQCPIPQPFERFRLDRVHHFLDFGIERRRLLGDGALPGAPHSAHDFSDLERIMRRGDFRAHMNQPDGGQASVQREFHRQDTD
jgi:hypothetical protein